MAQDLSSSAKMSAGSVPSIQSPGRVLCRVAAVVMGSVLVMSAVLLGVVLVAHRPGWFGAWLAAVIAGTVGALVALAPLVPGLLAGMESVAYATLAAALLRTLATLGVAFIAVVFFHTAAVPTLLLTVPLYFAQLVAEVLVLGRALGRTVG